MSWRCSRCGKIYAHRLSFCHDDGGAVVEVAEALAETAMPSPRTEPGGPDTHGEPIGATGLATQPQAAIAFEEPKLLTLSAGTPVGEYVIEKQIGEGGMGVIYFARQPIIGKRVAIKVLNPDMANNASAVQRFVQEARSVNQIGHRNIVDIFSFGRLTDGRHYFVMELLEGMALSDRIRQPLAWPEAIAIWLQVAGAVEAAHVRGIVHRDLKPDNLFVSPGAEGPFVKVLDFGIAKLMGDTGVTKTSTGVPIGTPLYMSPEQVSGALVDHRTDVYAMGCIFYETIAGEPPFSAATVFEVMSKQIAEPPPPFGTRAVVDPELEALVFAMLEKSPEARPPSMAAVHGELVRLRDDALRAGRSLFQRGSDPVAAASQDPTGVENATRQQTSRRAPPVDRAYTVPDPRASQVLPAAAPSSPPRSRTPYWLGLVLALATLAGVSYVALRPRPAPSAPVVAPPVATPPPQPTSGRVKLISTESGLTFFLDGQKVAEGGPVLQVNAQPGRHEIKVTRPGFLPYSNQVIVQAGETTDEVVKMQAEPLSPAPPPRHRSPKRDVPTPPGTNPPPRDRDATLNPFHAP